MADLDRAVVVAADESGRTHLSGLLDDMGLRVEAFDDAGKACVHVFGEVQLVVLRVGGRDPVALANIARLRGLAGMFAGFVVIVDGNDADVTRFGTMLGPLMPTVVASGSQSAEEFEAAMLRGLGRKPVPRQDAPSEPLTEVGAPPPAPVDDAPVDSAPADPAPAEPAPAEPTPAEPTPSSSAPAPPVAEEAVAQPDPPEATERLAAEAAPIEAPQPVTAPPPPRTPTQPPGRKPMLRAADLAPPRVPAGLTATRLRADHGRLKNADAFRRLGVERDAGDNDVRSAFSDLVALYNPRTVKAETSDDVAMLRDIHGWLREAYCSIGKEAARASYLREVGGPSGGTAPSAPAPSPSGPAETALAAAQLRVEAGDVPGAIGLLERAAARTRSDALEYQLALYRGKDAFERGDAALAHRHLLKAVHVFPNDSEEAQALLTKLLSAPPRVQR